MWLFIALFFTRPNYAVLLFSSAHRTGRVTAGELEKVLYTVGFKDMV